MNLSFREIGVIYKLSVFPNVIENFAQIVTKTMAKDRSGRFQTINDFIKAPEAALNLEIVQLTSNTPSIEIETKSLENAPSNSSLIDQVWTKIKDLFD